MSARGNRLYPSLGAEGKKHVNWHKKNAPSEEGTQVRLTQKVLGQCLGLHRRARYRHRDPLRLMELRLRGVPSPLPPKLGCLGKERWVCRQEGNRIRRSQELVIFGRIFSW